MNVADFIIIAIIGILLGAAIFYIYKSKKSGAKCIGCPNGGNCSGHSSGQSACKCGCHEDAK